MALRIRFQYPTGNQLGYTIEQLWTGYFFDNNLGVFVHRNKTSSENMIAQLPEDTTPFIGRYLTTFAATSPFIFPDGDYVVTVHNMAANNTVVAELAVTMRNGDDQTI